MYLPTDSILPFTTVSTKVLFFRNRCRKGICFLILTVKIFSSGLGPEQLPTLHNFVMNLKWKEGDEIKDKPPTIPK